MKNILLPLFALLLLVGCKEAPQPVTETPAEAALPEGFCLLTDSIPDAILEIRYYSTYNFIGQRIAGYEAPVAIITSEAAHALKGVSDDLKAQGYRLKICDTYRPQCAVDMFVAWGADLSDTAMKAYFYPTIAKERLIPEEYVAPKSSHSRGSTVDLTLVEMLTGKEVDMGSPFDFFGPLSHPASRSVSEEQYALRQLLREAMIAHGFKPYEAEWWHFTLKEEPFPDTYFNFPIAL